MQNDISGLKNESQTQISAAQNDIDSLKNESQAKISAAQNDIESIKRESQAEISATQDRLETVKRTAQSQLRSSQNTLDEIRGDIRSINREKNALTYSWLGNMAVSCVSFFAGDVFSVGGMLWDTAMLYTERGILDKQRESAERNYRQQKSEHERLRAESERLTQEARGNLETVKAHQARLNQQAKDNLETLKAHQQRLIQQAQDNLEIQRVRLSRLNEEMKQDEAMLKEELKASLWQLERQDIAECAALQERLLTASWNLMRKYGLPDEYRITQISLKNFYRAVNEDDVSRRSRMLRNLEDEFRVYPPYWYYRAKTAQEAGNLTEARKYFAEFNRIWRPVLRRDPYKLEAEKFMIQDLASSGKAIDEIMPEISAHLETVYDNTPKDDWADNIFLGGKTSKTFTIIIAKSENEANDAESESESQFQTYSEKNAESFTQSTNQSDKNREILHGHEYIAAVIPSVEIDEEGMYEFPLSLDVNVPEGLTLNCRVDSDDAVFFDDDGEMIDFVPENHSVTLGVWLEPGRVYEIVIYAKL